MALDFQKIELSVRTLFTIEAGPSEEISDIGKIKKDFAEKEKKRFDFFEQLLERCKQKTTLFSNISPVKYQGWLNAGAGKAGIAWALVALDKFSRTEFFFCSATAETNQKRFEALLAQKEKIEKAFGEPLVWDYKDGRKQHYIRSKCPLGGIENESKWPEIQNDLIDRLVRLEKAMREAIKTME